MFKQILNGYHMYIIKTKEMDTYFTDEVKKGDRFYEFLTSTKSGKTQKHILAMDQVTELIEQEGTVLESRKPKINEEE